MRSLPALSRWLLTRGAWLVFLELTFVRLFWTFNLHYERLLLAGILWVIGWEWPSRWPVPGSRG